MKYSKEAWSSNKKPTYARYVGIGVFVTVAKVWRSPPLVPKRKPKPKWNNNGITWRTGVKFRTRINAVPRAFSILEGTRSKKKAGLCRALRVLAKFGGRVHSKSILISNPRLNNPTLFTKQVCSQVQRAWSIRFHHKMFCFVSDLVPTIE